MWIGHRKSRKEKGRGYLSAKLFIVNYLLKSICYLISHLISKFSTCQIPSRSRRGRWQWRQQGWGKKLVPASCYGTARPSLHLTAGPCWRPSSSQASSATVAHRLPKDTYSLDGVLPRQSLHAAGWTFLTGLIGTRKQLMKDIMRTNGLIPR